MRPDRRARFVWASIAAAATWSALIASADEEPKFYRAINLNGPAAEIDNQRWEAGDAEGVLADGLAAFENQSVRLIPATDERRATMIRSSRWSPSGTAEIKVTGVPQGTYSVYLYVWEDNDPQMYEIQLNGTPVSEKYNSGRGGHWDRLGPWVIDIANGEVVLTAVGGHANLSGIEIWTGKLTKESNPLKGIQPAAADSSLEGRAAVLLARNCVECHNASDRKGGLDLTSRANALAGGDSGVLFKPGESAGILLEKVEQGEMPPPKRSPLSSEDRLLLREWIQAGAKYASDPLDPFLYSSDRRAGYDWWSLQPVRRVEPPAVADETWPRNHVDHFVRQRMDAHGLRPATEADRRTLIRRVTFDLIGLPPTPEDVDEFVDDADPKAYEKLVDRLLDSSHYGERWARRWLDLVRFGESQGFERNKLRPSAWKYRDFVVEAFNSDLPYDDFIRWQIAGDVLRPDDPLAVIASGFLAIGPYDLTAYNNGTPDMQAFAREEELEGLVGVVGQTFLGLTINCSRCHDHKFDPIRQREFYQISAALGGTYQGAEREITPDAARIATLRAEIEELRSDKITHLARISRLESLIQLLSGGPVHTTVPRQPGEWRILARGDYRQPTDAVFPGGISAVTGVSSDWQLPDDAPEAERRKALAEWIAHPDNPLTGRVIVNRLWGYHFGEGLVRTPSDFGFQGGLPSHPELLDWLAAELVHPADGPAWSLKRIQRLIVTSATYRQESNLDYGTQLVDADNFWFSRQNRQRLDAETFRDTMLTVSGELDPRLGGAGYCDFTISSAGDNETYSVFDAIGPEFNRRSIYRTWVRAGTSPLLDTLDCPDPSVPTPRRSVTSTPLQALTLLNDAVVEHYAARFAERLRRGAGENAAEQVQRAWRLALGSPPTDEEAKFSEEFLSQHGLTQLCIVLFNTNEFLYVD